MSVWSSTGPCLRNKATQCCLRSHCSSLARKNPNQHIKQQRFALFLWKPRCACLAVQQDIRGNGDTRTIIQARVLYEPFSAAQTGPSTTRLLVPSSVNLHSPGVEEDKEAVHLAPSDAPDWMKRTRCCSPRDATRFVSHAAAGADAVQSADEDLDVPQCAGWALCSLSQWAWEQHDMEIMTVWCWGSLGKMQIYNGL